MIAFTTLDMVGPTPQAKLSKAFSIGKLFLHAQRCFSLTQGQDSSRKHQKATPDSRFIAFRNCRMAPCARPSDSAASFQALRFDPLLPSFPSNVRKLARQHQKARQTASRQHQKPRQTVNVFQNCWMAPCARPSDSPACLGSLERARASPATPKATQATPACLVSLERATASPATSKATQATSDPPDCQFIAFWNCRMAPCAKPSH